MRVLVVERESGSAQRAVADLEAQGHEVVGCADADTAMPCKGFVEEAGCPIEHHPVDAALVVRGAAGGPSNEGEIGVRCALRRRVPVVVLGRADGAEFAPWVASTVPMDEPAVAERVAAAADAAFADVATRAAEVVREVLALRDVSSERVGVEVSRDGVRLLVTITLDAGVEETVGQLVAARVLAEIPRLRPGFAQVDIGVASAD